MGLMDKVTGVFKAKAERQADLQRNDQCWCGSGKKYKKCHYEEDRKRSQGKTAKKKST
ncbi:MAG: SEC-C metal-binding domain-containing protein [bacterium]